MPRKPPIDKTANGALPSGLTSRSSIFPLAHAEANLGKASFWLNTDRPPDAACVHWVGAGTKDTGISLTRLTCQITHATDSDTNAERDYIIGELRKSEVIGEINLYKAGQHLASEHVNHYITDGEITAASLIVGV
jgi:hypothetical protein